MYAAVINRPSPTTPSPRVPIAAALTGWSPASWAAACKRGRDAGHPRQARIARGDRRIEKEPRGVMRFRVPAASSWRCARSLAVGPAGSPVRWTTGCSPHQAQDSATISLETVADRLPAPLTRVPDAERPSLCR